MRRFFLILLAVAIVGALILSGCPAKEEPQKVLKIGASFGITNDWTGYNLEKSKWLKLFAKLINDQGGWKIGGDTYKVEMIIYDNQWDTTKAKADLEKLVLEDRVKIILDDPVGSPPVTTTVTEPNKVMVLGTDVTNTHADPQIQYYWEPVGMFFGRGLMFVMDREMADRGVRTYVSCKQDTEMGYWADGALKETWQVAAPEVECLDSVFYAPDTTDFAPVATKIKSINPDLVDCNYAGDPRLFKALQDVGFEGIIFPSQLNPDQFQAVLTTCGKEFMEGWMYFLPDPRVYENQTPEMLALMDAYTEEYGEFRTAGCMWVCYWFVLKDAIEQTQSVDVEILKAYLDNSPDPVKTLTGYCKLFARPEMGNLRTVTGTPADYVAIIEDGKEIPFRNIAVKDHYLASILSYGLVDVYKEYWEEYGYPTFPDEPTHVKFSDLGITGKD